MKLARNNAVRRMTTIGSELAANAAMLRAARAICPVLARVKVRLRDK